MRRAWFLLGLILVLGGGCDDGEATSDAAGSDLQPVPLAHSFGARCAPVADPCQAELVCMKTAGQEAGFCSKTCPTQGADCESELPGTLARCSLPIQLAGSPDTYACVFLCGQGAVCPQGLRCLTDTATADGYYSCLP